MQRGGEQGVSLARQAWMVPVALRSLPGHPRGGSVEPRSFPPVCLQEMRDEEGRALVGSWEVEKGEDG